MKHTVIAEILRELNKAHHGQLTPEIIVEEASSPDSPLHELFPWDNEIAGHKYRLAIARSIFRSVRFEIRTETFSFSNVPSYVHDPQSDEQGYVALESTSTATKHAVLLAELRMVAGHLNRSQEVAAATVPAAVKDLEELSDNLDSIITRIRRVRR